MVRLVPMREEVFEDYIQDSLREYAQAHVKAGNWSPSEATRRAEEQFQSLLPQGMQSEGHHLLEIEDQGSGEKVGVVWVAEMGRGEDRAAFVYDLRVAPPFRRRGYGERAMRSVEALVVGLGSRTINLHVFADNAAARALYKKLGYEVVKTFYGGGGEEPTSYRMSKTLGIA